MKYYGLLGFFLVSISAYTAPAGDPIGIEKTMRSWYPGRAGALTTVNEFPDTPGDHIWIVDDAFCTTNPLVVDAVPVIGLAIFCPSAYQSTLLFEN